MLHNCRSWMCYHRGGWLGAQTHQSDCGENGFAPVGGSLGIVDTLHDPMIPILPTVIALGCFKIGGHQGVLVGSAVRALWFGSAALGLVRTLGADLFNFAVHTDAPGKTAAARGASAGGRGSHCRRKFSLRVCKVSPETGESDLTSNPPGITDTT